MSRASLLFALAVAVSFPAMACVAASEEAPLEGVDENAPADESAAESIHGNVAVGSTLVATANLNLRNGPGTSHAIEKVIPQGASVTVVDAQPQSGWYHVRYGGTVGWSIGTYLGRPGSGGTTWSCNGSWGTTQASDARYYLTAFGCWRDSGGGVHTDPGDNCIPGCLAEAKAEGLCHPGDSGPGCEERVSWYVADAGRFGCGTRVKITANGKSVVAAVLDYGPACWVERNVHEGVLDASGRVNRFLFGSDMGAVDHAAVHVEVVSKSTPLGPQ